MFSNLLKFRNHQPITSSKTPPYLYGNVIFSKKYWAYLLSLGSTCSPRSNGWEPLELDSQIKYSWRKISCQESFGSVQKWNDKTLPIVQVCKDIFHSNFFTEVRVSILLVKLDLNSNELIFCLSVWFLYLFLCFSHSKHSVFLPNLLHKIVLILELIHDNWTTFQMFKLIFAHDNRTASTVSIRQGQLPLTKLSWFHRQAKQVEPSPKDVAKIFK